MSQQDSDYYGLKDGEVSTGTTIMVLPCPVYNTVILGADSRVSTGTYVANRTSDKIVQLSSRIFACRSGSAADTQAITDYVRFYISQLSIEMGRPVRVKTAAHIMSKICYNNKDNLSAGLIVAGYDPVDGISVYSIPMGGTCLKVPFAVGGSGSTYIYGLIDSQFNPNVTVEDAKKLVKQCVAHAMARDGSSGGVIRTVTVSPDEVVRDYTPGNALPFGPVGY